MLPVAPDGLFVVGLVRSQDEVAGFVLALASLAVALRLEHAARTERRAKKNA
ncbi:MAG: hypothetical protein ACYDCK_13090 [Thermoplasmatota archaeon]